MNAFISVFFCCIDNTSYSLQLSSRAIDVSSQGLHVYATTAPLAKALRGNATARAEFRGRVEYMGSSLTDASGTHAYRFEVMEGHDDGDAQFTALAVHWKRQEEPLLPSWLTESLQLSEATTARYTTVFPERSRWKEAQPAIEPGELGEIGRISLLAQQIRFHVDAQSTDAFRRAWPDLGYNSLGEPGVLRCDLMEAESTDESNAPVSDSTAEHGSIMFIARKVFRNAAALREHEASEHYQRWIETARPLLHASTTQPPATLLDTLHPRTSPFPFRSRWMTI